MVKKMSDAAAEIAKYEIAEAQKATAAETSSATPPADASVKDDSTDFWTSKRIAEIADSVAQNIGADQNDLPRTLFVALTGEHFLPVCAYPYLLLARRALVGVAMMVVASLAHPSKTDAVPYTFDVGYVPGASKLVEIWTARSGDKIVARYMLAPTGTIADDLVRAEATVAVFSVKTETKSE